MTPPMEPESTVLAALANMVRMLMSMAMVSKIEVNFLVFFTMEDLLFNSI